MLKLSVCCYPCSHERIYDCKRIAEKIFGIFQTKRSQSDPLGFTCSRTRPDGFIHYSRYAPFGTLFAWGGTPPRKRLTNVQKCLRTDDIEDVGDAWHNTFFEMLGNWSLGDYWKEEAISWSFEFLTKELGLDPKRISVTVFGGDPQIPGVSEDTESVEIWKKLGIPEERIYRLGKEDNWWGPVGESGPCGPDTEMFYDLGKDAHGKTCRPGENCGKYTEVWNDVFMEYNRTKEGKYEPLTQKNVDTGMGLERMIGVLQGRDNIYDTELFSPVINKIKDLSSSYKETSGRIVADHLRAATFLLADKVIPSNNERGYVLRRLIRRAIRHGRLLGINGSFAAKVAEGFFEIYKEAYPKLSEKVDSIFSELSTEEEKFQKLLPRASENLRSWAKKFPEKMSSNFMNLTVSLLS